MPRLTQEQIDARMEAYEEAAGHLEYCSGLPVAKVEQEQYEVLAKQLRTQADEWYASNSG